MKIITGILGSVKTFILRFKIKMSLKLLFLWDKFFNNIDEWQLKQYLKIREYHLKKVAEGMSTKNTLKMEKWDSFEEIE